MCLAAALLHLAPPLKERERRPRYFFTPAMDDEIRHAYHQYVDYDNRKPIAGHGARRRPRFGSGERAGGVPKKWLCSSGWDTLRTPSSAAS